MGLRHAVQVLLRNVLTTRGANKPGIYGISWPRLDTLAARSLGLVLFFLAATLATMLAILATARPEASWRDAARGALALAGWLLVVFRAPDLIEHNSLGNGGWAALLFAGSVALVVVMVPRVVAAGRA